MYKILVTEPEYFPEESIKILRQVGNVTAKRLDRKELMDEVKDTDILVVRIETLVDKEVLGNAKKLKIIASPTTGLNHIDVTEAEKKGIKVINLPGINAVATAEHAFALILSLVRKIPWASKEMERGRWERHQFFGRELEGKTLGTVGLGRIGRKVADYAKAFGMKVIAYDPYVDKEKLTGSDIELTSLEDVIKKSDIITIHAMLTKETENMITIKEFGIMKRDSLLINVSRGKIINEIDLVNALRKKLIAGAALDVYSKEPVEENDLLVEYAKSNNNLLLTPHIAGSTEESITNAAIQVVQKIKETVKG